jgi:hypothetical protein
MYSPCRGAMGATRAGQVQAANAARPGRRRASRGSGAGAPNTSDVFAGPVAGGGGASATGTTRRSGWRCRGRPRGPRPHHGAVAARPAAPIAARVPSRSATSRTASAVETAGTTAAPGRARPAGEHWPSAWGCELTTVISSSAGSRPATGGRTPAGGPRRPARRRRLQREAVEHRVHAALDAFSTGTSALQPASWTDSTTSRRVESGTGSSSGPRRTAPRR